MPLDYSLQNGPSDEVCADYLRQVRTQKRKCDEANGVLRSILKRAKADGIDTKALNGAIAKTKQEPDVVAASMAAEIRYLGILRVATITPDALFAGYQIDYEAPRSAADLEWEAGEAGYQAGRHATPIDECPYEPGSPHHVTWRKSWHDGQAANAEVLGDNAKQASTSKARPKRAAESDDDEDTEATPPAPAPAGKSRRGRRSDRNQAAGLTH